MIIYNSVYMINFNSMNKGYIVGWQSDLVNTKESVLPVCDKPYQTDNELQQNGRRLKIAELCIGRSLSKNTTGKE